MAKIPAKKFLSMVVIITSVTLFLYIIWRAMFYAPSDEVPLPETALAQTAGMAAGASSPAKLTIPKIKLDAKVLPVGITKKGNMATPGNFSDVGWYKYGKTPGEIGSAVIAGHVDNGLALPAVFFNLKNMTKGDDIYLTDQNNKTMHFVVTKTEVYDFDSNAEEVFTDESGRLLKLITCTGVWLKQYRTHDKRLVVSAELAES
ncbi:MAG TPA: class F sortase [Candidatus Paceibacterota bacterium]